MLWKLRRRPTPLIEIHHHVIDKVAVINGVVSGIALYPQVWHIMRSRDFASVSQISALIILGNNVVWALYAFHRGLISLFIAALLNMLAALALLILALAL